MGIDDDYLAYCFDEVALYLESEAIDSKGATNWNKIKWNSKDKVGGNEEFMKHIEEVGR